MKQIKIIAALFAFTLCFSSHAQYSIDWHKVAGGGGTSTGGWTNSVSGATNPVTAPRPAPAQIPSSVPALICSAAPIQKLKHKSR